MASVFDDETESTCQAALEDFMICDRGIREYIFSFLNIFNETRRFLPYRIGFVSGSLADENILSRNLACPGTLEIECDIMIIFGTIPQEMQLGWQNGRTYLPSNIVDMDKLVNDIMDREIKDKLFANVNRRKTFKKFDNVDLSQQDAFPIMDLLREISESIFKWSDDRKLLQTILAMIFNAKQVQLTSHPHYTNKGPSRKFSFEAHLDSVESNRKYNVDIVLCLALASWPFAAAEWPIRYRLWPNNEVVESAVEIGCHLVIKPAPKNMSSLYNLRLSFSKVETFLLTQLTPGQRGAYRFTKMVYYKFIAPVLKDSSIISSYTAKTICLRLFEQNDPGIWSQLGTIKSALKILTELKAALDDKVIPNFFVPDVNILEDVDAEDLRNACTALNTFLNNSKEHIPGLLEHVRQITADSMKELNRLENIAVIAQLAKLLWSSSDWNNAPDTEFQIPKPKF